MEEDEAALEVTNAAVEEEDTSISWPGCTPHMAAKVADGLADEEEEEEVLVSATLTPRPPAAVPEVEEAVVETMTGGALMPESPAELLSVLEATLIELRCDVSWFSAAVAGAAVAAG